MTTRPFNPLSRPTGDHVLDGDPCLYCGEKFLVGERPALVAFEPTDDPKIQMAKVVHWTCFLARKAIITWVRDEQATPAGGTSDNDEDTLNRVAALLERSRDVGAKV